MKSITLTSRSIQLAQALAYDLHVLQKIMKSNHVLILCLILSVSCGIGGYLIGEKAGIKKGAETGAPLAKMFLDSQKDFTLLLENAMNEGQPAEGEIKELMISGLETYLPSRMLLASSPFNQRYDRFTEDQEEIDEAIERLKNNELKLEYN